MSALADDLLDDLGGLDWRHRAACRHTSPAVFHPGPPGSQPEPPAPGSGDPDPYAPAKRICHANGGCPVRAQCLAWALGEDQDRGPGEDTGPRELWGVWGGLDPREREELLQRRRRPTPDAEASNRPVLVAVGPDDTGGAP
jgi:WhiB family transcriptional regulator, redox-sensing transcriptional regulator